MNSFTRKLILYCTGVVFISFLVVYFLFNIMVSNYIRAEAERELAGGMMDVVGLTYAFPTMMMIESAAMPYRSVRLVSHGHTPYMRLGRFQMEFRPHTEWSTIFIDEYNAQWSQTSPDLPVEIQGGMGIIEGLVPFTGYSPSYMQNGMDGFETERLVPRSEIVLSEWEGTAQLTFHPIRQQSFVTTDVIMIGADSGLITPRLEFLPYSQRAEVEFLVDYYLSNQARLSQDEMTRVAGAGTTFYLSTSSQAIGDTNFSILMYTDISAAMAFTNSMNRILGVLLVLSGLASLAISAAMSARFKRAIVRLCGYAETIGRGNFNQKAGPFCDTEFDRLSKSMDNMSNMLQSYENNQKQFFQNVSHELRTPLMSILGYAEGIMKDIFTKEEAADIILAEGQKMAGLVDELLYISRIDNTGIIESSGTCADGLLYVSQIDDELPHTSQLGNTTETSGTSPTLAVKELLYECCDRIKPIAQKAGKQVAIEMPQEIPNNANAETQTQEIQKNPGAETQPQEIHITADTEALARAIINILSNAIRHADCNVKIKYHAAGGSLKIIIEDDGNGIHPNDLPHIFQRFYKGENGNHGLGLAISKDIIKSMGGSISVQNKNAPESGAVFTVELQL